MHTAKVTPCSASALSPEAHRLLDLLEDGFVFLDSGLRITDLNAAAEPLIGLPRADVLGKESVNLLPEPVGAADDPDWRQQLQQRDRVEFDCRSRRSDRWLRAKAYCAPDGGVCIQYRDITDERRVHFELASREAELSTIADALPALISYIDKDGRYRFVNRQYEDWFGHSRKEILGRHMSDVLGEKVFAALKPNIERVLAGEHLSFETFAPYRDGGSRHIQASYEPRYFENEVVGFFALVTDISQRKRAELLLADQNHVLESLASATNLEIILEELCEALERQLHDSALVTILVADESGSFLTVAAGNKCPEEFRSALGKIPVAPGAGTCGTAA